MTEKEKPSTISLPLFIKILQSFSVEKLRKISIERLPESVPEHFSEHLSPEKKQFLEDFHMAKQMARMNEYNGNIQLLGKETADIIEQIKSNRLVNQTSFFVEKVENLQIMADKHSLQKCAKIPSVRLLKQADIIHDMLSDIRAEYVTALKYVPLIKAHYNKSAEIDNKLKSYIKDLRIQLIPVHKIIVGFYQLRLTINLCEMRHLKIKIQDTEADIENIDQQLKEISEELETHKNLWAKMASKNDEVLSLQKQINELHQMREQLDVPIDENRLTRWLDSLIDVFVGPGTESIANSKYAQYAQRMIFFLLVEYCEQQEAAAKDVAENPFIVINAEKAIDFLLSSEKFILHYFDRKKKEMSGWLDNVVTDKKGALDVIKQDLLSEMKRNIKFVR